MGRVSVAASALVVGLALFWGCASLEGLSTGAKDAGPEASQPPGDGGTPDTTDGGADSSTPDVAKAGDAGCDGSAPDPNLLSNAVHIAVGNGFACAVRGDGTVVCWGQYFRGQLGFVPDGGIGVQGTDFVLKPIVIAGLAGITSIAAGDSHACAIDKANHVWCWGFNSNGQLGNGLFSPTHGLDYISMNSVVVDWDPRPALVLSKAGGNLELAVAVSCGLDHTCAFVQGGVAACWGNNDSGQLGEPGGSGAFETSAVPSSVSRGGAVSVSAGFSCSCAVVQGTPSTVECTGSNASGQLGASPPDSGVAVAMPLPASARTPQGVTSSFYTSHHTVILDVGGNAFGAGDNSGGALGAFNSPAPAAIPGLSNGNVVQVATGPAHTCAILTDGTLQCMGQNRWGELGRGFASTTNSNDPDYVEAPSPNAPELDASDGTRLRDVMDVGIGLEATCAVVRNACRSDGTVYCWGANFVGQLGNGTQNPTVGQDRPTMVLAP